MRAVGAMPAPADDSVRLMLRGRARGVVRASASIPRRSSALINRELRGHGAEGLQKTFTARMEQQFDEWPWVEEVVEATVDARSIVLLDRAAAR